MQKYTDFTEYANFYQTFFKVFFQDFTNRLKNKSLRMQTFTTPGMCAIFNRHRADTGPACAPSLPGMAHIPGKV